MCGHPLPFTETRSSSAVCQITLCRSLEKIGHIECRRKGFTVFLRLQIVTILCNSSARYKGGWEDLDCQRCWQSSFFIQRNNRGGSETRSPCPRRGRGNSRPSKEGGGRKIDFSQNTLCLVMGQILFSASLLAAHRCCIYLGRTCPPDAARHAPDSPSGRLRGAISSGVTLVVEPS